MSVRLAVEDKLAGQSGWRVEMALALADEVDAKGNASAAKELRSVMTELGADDPTVSQPVKETGLSDFERRLAERQAATTRSASNG